MSERTAAETMTDGPNVWTWPGSAAIRAMAASLGLMGLLAGGAACAKKPPMVQAPPAPLEVPVVPPRLVGPVMVEEPEMTPVEAPEPAAPRPRQPRPAPARTNDPVVKVEPPPESGAKPAEGSGQSSSGSGQGEPAPLLRTPDTANDVEVSRKVRETLSRAGENLNKVNYNGLNPGAKSQYDTARRFIAQAEEALKGGKSLSFARFVADKAELLSASLLNR